MVEDDQPTASAIERYLAHAGFRVIRAADGASGLAIARAGEADLVVLDLMLPGLSGLELCRRVRAAGSAIPILALTARTSEDDRVRGLETGADDYLGKPFSPRELVARIRALLRRVEGHGATLAFPGLRIDRAAPRAVVHGEEVRLTATEWRILTALASAPRRVLSRARLRELALERPDGSDDRVIDAHVKNLRRKIEADPARPALVETVHGSGYRFVPPPAAP